jgi:hypothetical protein
MVDVNRGSAAPSSQHGFAWGKEDLMQQRWTLFNWMQHQ